MKQKNILFAILCLLVPVTLSAQTTFEGRNFAQKDPALGGDVVLGKSYHALVNGQSSTTFELTAPKGGSYHLSLWAMPALYPSTGKYSSYEVTVNGTKIAETVEFTCENWQAFALTNPVTLSAGRNTIGFISKYETPLIEFIRLSTDRSRAAISSKAYDDYLAGIKAKAATPQSTLRSMTEDEAREYILGTSSAGNPIVDVRDGKLYASFYPSIHRPDSFFMEVRFYSKPTKERTYDVYVNGLKQDEPLIATPGSILYYTPEERIYYGGMSEGALKGLRYSGKIYLKETGVEEIQGGPDANGRFWRGKNTVTFVTDYDGGPWSPEIPYWEVSEISGFSLATDPKYLEPIPASEGVADPTDPTEEPTTSEETNPNSVLYHAAMTGGRPVTNDSQGIPALQPAPLANYQYAPAVTYNYTFCVPLYNYSYEPTDFDIYITPLNTSIDMVLEVFNKANPSSGFAYQIGPNESFSVGAGWSTGVYYARIRSTNNNIPMLANVTIKTVSGGTVVYNNVPVAGTIITAPQTGGNCNTFTTATTDGDPVIYLASAPSNSSYIGGIIKGYNDDYQGQGNFKWGLDARISKNLYTVATVEISSSFSHAPVGTSDVYINAKPAVTQPSSAFPLLKADDIIQSAPASAEYNGLSWAGGQTTVSVYPENSAFPYYTGNSLTTLDQYFSNTRYAGCNYYLRSIATSSNSEIDLYRKTVSGGYEYHHAAIKNIAGDYPHGYDYESKLGSGERAFHYRYSLNSGTYGSAFDYYKRVSFSGEPISAAEAGSTYLLEESIADGKSVMESVELDDAELALLAADIAKLTTAEVQQFQSLYEAWLTTLPEINSWNDLASTDQYAALLSLSGTKAEYIALAIEHLFDGGEYAARLIQDLTLGDPANDDILSDIRAESVTLRYDASGAQIVSTANSNMRKYVKALLSDRAAELRAGTTSVEAASAGSFSVAQTAPGVASISLTLAKDAKVSLSVVDLKGRPAATLLNGARLPAGRSDYAVSLPQGVYLVVYNLSGTTQVKKIAVK
jgi:hypothetical protein